MLFDPAKWALVLGALARLSFAYHLNSKSVVGQGHHAFAAQRWTPEANNFWAVLTDVIPEKKAWFFTGSNPQFMAESSRDMFFSHDAFITTLSHAAEARGERFPSSGRVQFITVGPWNGEDAEAALSGLMQQLKVSSTQNYQYLPDIEIEMRHRLTMEEQVNATLEFATMVRGMMIGNDVSESRAPLIIYMHCQRGGDRTGNIKATYGMLYGGFTGTGATHVEGPRDAKDAWRQSIAEVPDQRGMQEYRTSIFVEVCRKIGRTRADCELNATCGYELDNPYGPFCRPE